MAGRHPIGSQRDPVNRRAPPRMPSRTALTPNAAIPASNSPPVASTVRRETPFRGAAETTRQRCGNRWTATTGTSTRPSQACSVRTVHEPMVSSSPPATHRNPPVSAPATSSATIAANARRRQRPDSTARGTDRRSFQTVAATRAPPSSPCRTNTQLAAGPPAFSDSSPVAAMPTTRSTSTRSSVA